MKKRYSYITLFTFASLVAQSQPNADPQVGQNCPEFTFHDVHYPEMEKVTLSDFEGKWLILDFWSKTCVICPRSFPKLSQLQEVFRDSIQFLLVGINNTRFNADIEAFYDDLRLKHNLQLPVAYDSVAKKDFGVHTVPHVVIVDPARIIRAITLPSEINEDVLRSLLAGKNPVIKQKAD